MDITQARNNVINNQIRPWGGLNYKANNSLMDIPRELFVPKNYQNLAFSDIQIPLSDKAAMFEPKMEGRILSSLDIKKHEKVLEIGTGSGYFTACMAQLADSVTSLEIDEELHISAAQKLKQLKINNVKLLVYDASQTLKNAELFDVVVVGTAVPKIISSYLYLLNIKGRIFIVEGTGDLMSAKLITRISEKEWKTQTLFETSLTIMQGLEIADEFNF